MLYALLLATLVIALFAGCASAPAGGYGGKMAARTEKEEYDAERRKEEEARRRAEAERARSAAPAQNPDYCPHCGKRIRADDNFCEACGGGLPHGNAAPSSGK